MLAAGFASTIGGLPFNSLPVLLGALADTFSLSPQATGLLGSSCFAGYLVGTLAAAWFMNRSNWRWLTLGCALGTAAALLASTIAPASFQYFLWALIGLFSASMTCLGLRIMGGLPNKERALGVRQGIELGVTSAVLFALPPLIIARFHYPGAAVTLAVMVLVLAVSAFGLPAGGAALETEAPRPAGEHPHALPAYAALGVFFLYGTGQIGLWAFLERMGQGIHLSPTELGTVFAVLKLLGGAAAFAGAAIGDRLGFRLPHLVAFAVLMMGLTLLTSARDFLNFGLGAWIWEVGFTWGCLFQTAAMARLDPSGRAIMLVPAAFGLSSMVGPSMAGFLVADGFAPLITAAFICALAPLLSYWLVLARRLSTPAIPVPDIQP
jgi:fucose permease